MQSIAHEAHTPEQLRERIEKLEALRDRAKRCRAGFQVMQAEALLDEARRMLAQARKPYVSPRCGKCGGEAIKRGIRMRGQTYDRCRSCGSLWSRATRRWLRRLW